MTERDASGFVPDEAVNDQGNETEHHKAKTEAAKDRSEQADEGQQDAQQGEQAQGSESESATG